AGQVRALAAVLARVVRTLVDVHLAVRAGEAGVSHAAPDRIAHAVVVAGGRGLAERARRIAVVVDGAGLAVRPRAVVVAGAVALGVAGAGAATRRGRVAELAVRIAEVVRRARAAAGSRVSGGTRARPVVVGHAVAAARGLVAVLALRSVEAGGTEALAAAGDAVA